MKNFKLLLWLIIVPILLLYVFGLFSYNSILKSEINTTKINQLFKVRDMVDSVIVDTKRIITAIISDEYVESFMFSSNESISQDNIFLRSKSINRLLKSYTLSNDYIDSIYIYSKRNDYVIGSTTSNYLKYFIDNQWYEQYEKDNESYNDLIQLRQVNNILGDNKNYNFISFLSNIRPFTNIEGLLIINVDISKLEKNINMSIDTSYNDLFIINENNKIIYSKNLNYLNKNITELFNIGNNSGSTFVQNFNGDKTVISVENSANIKWKYVSATKFGYYEKSLYYIKGYIFVLILIALIATVIISYFISYKIYQPINNIISLINNPNKTIYKQVNNETIQDEYSYISQNIIRVFELNKKMEERLNDNTFLLNKAQTIALQSQINPHFLFNTLGTIKLMAMTLTKGENDVSTMISNLSKLFMFSLDTKEHLVTIEQEINHANCYVEILKIRYKNKFDFVWDVDKEILNCKIAKITLQPIIENAVYHGIKPMNTKGNIIVKGYAEYDNVVIEIIDNGIGLDPEKVNTLNKSMAEDFIKESNHIGLSNVNQRIKLLFDKRYGLVIYSEPNKGTKVTMRIPKNILYEI